MVSFDVTLRTLSLGAAADSYTGWYPKTFTESTIDMVLQPAGGVVIGLPCGSLTLSYRKERA
jgi:hypothetical protein